MEVNWFRGSSQTASSELDTLWGKAPRFRRLAREKVGEPGPGAGWRVSSWPPAESRPFGTIPGFARTSRPSWMLCAEGSGL
jgi:hypothetical protein